MKRRTLLALALPAALPAAEGFAVITQKNNMRPFTKAQLKALFMGQGASWPGGGKIKLMLGPAGDPARLAALKQIAGMSEADYSKQLIHLGFIGQVDAAPLTLPSAAAVRQLVQLAAGSVGVVAPADVNDSVKELQFE
jgi:hypothetical protein